MKQHTTTQPTSPTQHDDVKPLIWTVSESRSRHTTGWFIALGVVGIAIAIGLFIIGNGTASLAAIAGAASLIVINATKPRAWKHTLTGGSLRIQTLRGAKVDKTIPLNRFKAFTFIDDTTPSEVVLLLPRNLVQGTFPLQLPRDDAVGEKVIDALSDSLPYSAAEHIQQQERVLDAVTKHTKLS